MNARTAALLTAAAVLMSTGIVLMHEDVKGELIEVTTVLLPGLQEAPSAEVPTGVTLDDLAPCGSLRTGDLVFRRGFGTESRLIIEAQGPNMAPFSHVGMVVSEHPVMIVHATTSDDPAHPNSVISSSLPEFLSMGDMAGVARPAWSDALKAAAAGRARGMTGVAFRLVPDDPDALYCTTLIEKSFEPDLKLDLPRDVVKVPVVGGSYLFPAALWEADGMTHVCMIGKQKTSKP